MCIPIYRDMCTKPAEAKEKKRKKRKRTEEKQEEEEEVHAERSINRFPRRVAR